MPTRTPATTLRNAGSYGATSSAALTSMHPFRSRSLSERFHEFLKKSLDRPERRQGLATSNSVDDAFLDIVIQRLLVERALIAKRVVEAGRGNAGMRHEVPDRSRLIALFPKA